MTARSPLTPLSWLSLCEALGLMPLACSDPQTGRMGHPVSMADLRGEGQSRFVRASLLHVCLVTLLRMENPRTELCPVPHVTPSDWAL